ncbi:spore coat U domain-containing protein [Rhodoferax ferrireducens]|uniref:Csu type fimbrial protein n=1 Tax=Rhodoferax ferrireducens TaxID=192843 RepID=UPI003BB4FF31
MKKMILHAAAMLGLALPLPASALCTLLCSCTVSTTSVAFGVYNPLFASPLDSSGNVRMTCGGVVGLLVPFDIAISKGSYSTSFSPRKMASGSNRLEYDLYTSSARTTIWGDGSNGTQIVSGSVFIVLLGGSSQDFTVFGRIPGGQVTVPPGTYSDSTTVTVTYY